MPVRIGAPTHRTPEQRMGTKTAIKAWKPRPHAYLGRLERHECVTSDQYLALEP